MLLLFAFHSKKKGTKAVTRAVGTVSKDIKLHNLGAKMYHLGNMHPLGINKVQRYTF